MNRRKFIWSVPVVTVIALPAHGVMTAPEPFTRESYELFCDVINGGTDCYEWAANPVMGFCDDRPDVEYCNVTAKGVPLEIEK